MRVIAIDGPVGAGKSTVARAVAQRLGLGVLETGAMYRAVAATVLRQGIEPGPATAAEVAEIARRMALDVGSRVLLDGEDVTGPIRSPEVDVAVSAVAANSAVRDELRDRQRAWAAAHDGGVIEGRDIGSVVFPEADLKLYLTAAAAVRAQRRHKEVADLAYEEVAASIAERDALDQGRVDSPLLEADGAIVIDTTGRDVDDIVDEIMKLLP